MSFALTLAPELHSDDGWLYFFGTIQIGDEVEHFKADANSLGQDEYQRLWLEALRLTVDEGQTSVLVTSISKRDASVINFFEGWVLYRFQDGVYLQNCLFFMKGNEDLSTIGGIALLAGEYRTTNEDSQNISTWYLKIDDVLHFYTSELRRTKQLEGEF